MIKTGLKLWSTNIDNYLLLSKKLYEKGLFDYIELYVVPDTLCNIEKWRELNIPFDIHAPHSAHGMNLSLKSNLENNLKLYDEVKIYADKLDARYIVFHGGSGGDYKECAYQLKKINDRRALIENKPYDTLKFVKAKRYTGSMPCEIKYIIDNANCKFCLDIGHAICCANSFNMDIFEFIKEFSLLEPLKLHLSDIDIKTKLDMHLNYGRGSLDFSKLLYLFKKVKDITIETPKTSKENLDDFIKDVEFLRKLNEQA